MAGNIIRAWVLGCFALIWAAGAAQALEVANPMKYFALNSSGGELNPGVIVGFNPQPDPPGFPTLDLANPFDPALVQPGGPATFDFVMSFTGLPGVLLPAVQMPGTDGMTTFAFDYGRRAFDVAVSFSGPGGVVNWVSFNPQPDPPGVWFANAVTFAGVGDPMMSFSMTEDGTSLRFMAAPEPSTWALIGLGFAALGVLGYRRGKWSSPVIVKA